MTASRVSRGTDPDRSLCVAGRKYFGTWRATLAAAGIRPPTVTYADKQAIIEALRERKKSGVPMIVTYLYRRGPHRDVPLLSAIKREFGRWAGALEAAGLASDRTPYPDRDSVIKEIKRRKRRGLPLNKGALQAGDNRDHSLTYASAKLFGSWHRAIVAAGLSCEEIKPRARRRGGSV